MNFITVYWYFYHTKKIMQIFVKTRGGTIALDDESDTIRSLRVPNTKKKSVLNTNHEHS